MEVIIISNRTGIYRFVNTVNGKSYVGKAVDLRHRYLEHVRALRRGEDLCVALNRAWSKYGEDNFKYEVLCTCDRESLNNKERYYISLYDSFNNGYNCTMGGDGMQGFRHSEESKKKIGDFFRGKTLSEEHKRKISDAQKGVPKPAWLVQKYRDVWTDERRKLMTETRSGENNPNYGKTGKDACSKKPVVSSTGEFFFTRRDAARWCGLKSYGNLSSCVNGARKYCGRHPITNEQLSWRNATDEEIKMHIKSA